MLTTESVLKKVDADIKRKRVEVTRLHEELEDLMDYLEVLSARSGNAPIPRTRWRSATASSSLVPSYSSQSS